LAGPGQPVVLRLVELSAGRNYRLITDMTTALVAEHYLTQLVAHGWTVAFKEVQTTLAVVRFSAGSASDPFIGTLTVVPFASSGQSVVSVRLDRSRGWRDSGRAGGGGANVRHGLMVPFGVHDGRRDERRQLQFPLEVARAELQDGGGGPDHMLSKMRLQTSMAPNALMMHVQAQLSPDGWKLDVLAGDARQAVVRRSTSPTGDKSELWVLTSMPGTDEIDMVLIVIASNR
jgi:hypothetical protein